MNQDFLNENKEEQKTEQTPTQTENKETAPQAVPANAVEEKKAVQEDEEEVSSQSEQHQQTAEQYQQPQQQANHTYHSPYQAQQPYGNGQQYGQSWHVLLINRHTTSSRIKEISSSLFILMVNHNILCIRSQIQGAMVLQLPPWF